jgi:hypothetical protein
MRTTLFRALHASGDFDDYCAFHLWRERRRITRPVATTTSRSPQDQLTSNEPHRFPFMTSGCAATPGGCYRAAEIPVPGWHCSRASRFAAC